MKTLIIHPDDPSTDFLKPIYEHVSDATIIHGGVSKATIKQLITEHDRIMMMGHGSPAGLFHVGQFIINGKDNGYIIDQSMIPILKEKDNNVFIWCNADKFVDGFKLEGFYSGMFISEVGEAHYCGLPGTEQDQVD